MKTEKTLVALATSALFALGSAEAAVFNTQVADTFNSNSGAVNNRALETPQPGFAVGGDDWSPGDGTAKVEGGYLQIGGTFGKAATGFDDSLIDSSGLGFTYTVDFSIADADWSDNNAFTYFGVDDQVGDGATHSDGPIAIGFRLQGDFTSTSVTLRAGDGNLTGGDDINTAFTRVNDSTDWAGTFSFTYTFATQNAEFFVDGGSIGSITYNDASEIGGIVFKSDNVAGGGTNFFRYDNLNVSSFANAPEPSSLALLLIGGALLSGARKKGLQLS